MNILNLGVALLISLFTLAACSKVEHVSSLPTASPAMQIAPEQIALELYQLVLQRGKPAAPVNIRYRLLENLQTGQEIEVELIISSARGEILRPQIATQNYAQLMSRKKVPQKTKIPALSDKFVRIERIVVNLTAGERHNLIVTAGIEHENRQQFRTVSIPLETPSQKTRISSPELIQSGKILQDEQGQAIIQNPAN